MFLFVLLNTLVLVSSAAGAFLVGSCLVDLCRLETPSALRQAVIMMAGTVLWMVCGRQPFLANGTAGFSILSAFGTVSLATILVEYVWVRYYLWKCWG